MYAGRGGANVRDTEEERLRAKTRNLRWMESLWDGTSTTAQEESKKEEVLALLRNLAEDSKRESEVHEYVPWQPLW